MYSKATGKLLVGHVSNNFSMFHQFSPEAITGKPVTVHYTGWLLKGYDSNGMPIKGRMFDSSRRRRRTFSFKIGVGRVIKGWDQGVGAMKVGGRRLLIIPAKLGYGQRGAGRVIPPGATLLFDVELISVP